VVVVENSLFFAFSRCFFKFSLKKIKKKNNCKLGMGGYIQLVRLRINSYVAMVQGMPKRG
jgi:hypothetical protein